jgi:hypothetical protein
MNPGRCRRLCLLATFAVTTLIACSSTPAATSGQSGGGSSPAGSSNAASAASASTQAARQQSTVPTTTAPEKACAWIPAAEVEAIVGKLAGPPKEKDGCRYTLLMPDSVRALREKELRAFEAMGGTKDDAIKNYRYDPDTYAVTLSVDWNGGVGVGKLAVAKMFGADVEQDAPGGGTTDAARAAPSGWDEEKRLVHGFMGRTGHLGVTVDSEASDVPTEPMVRLATAVRDRIPDVPFQVKNRYQIMMDVPANADPCGLLTRAEAEAVLGPLLVNPYHSSSYFPPLAHPNGNACAYFTAGHHVFVLMPEWTKGAQTFALEKGIGGLVQQVMPQQETVIFKGPWDKSQVTMTGTLDFLKGDRKLEVSFLRSSTNRIGALKLATLAMQRLSAMSYETRTTPALPKDQADGRVAAGRRAVVLLDGKPVGLLMPLK